MSEKVIAFDIEIIHDVKPPYSWGRPEELGIGVACTYSPEEGYRDWFGGYDHPHWESNDIAGLIAYLRGFDRILTWNGVKFDFRVLDGYILNSKQAEIEGVPFCHVNFEGKHTDMMLDAQDSCGHRVSLGSVTEALFDDEKMMDGAKAPAMWRAGQRLEVIQYCRDDVFKTFMVWKFGNEHGYIESAYRGNVKQIDVKWTLR